MNASESEQTSSNKMNPVFQSITLTPISRTLWLMIGRVLDYDIKVGLIMQPDLADLDRLNFTIAAITFYDRAVSELSSGCSCALIVQVPKSSDDDLVRMLPKTFVLKAGANA